MLKRKGEKNYREFNGFSFSQTTWIICPDKQLVVTVEQLGQQPLTCCPLTLRFGQRQVCLLVYCELITYRNDKNNYGGNGRHVNCYLDTSLWVTISFFLLAYHIDNGDNGRHVNCYLDTSLWVKISLFFLLAYHIDNGDNGQRTLYQLLPWHFDLWSEWFDHVDYPSYQPKRGGWVSFSSNSAIWLWKLLLILSLVLIGT